MMSRFHHLEATWKHLGFNVTHSLMVMVCHSPASHQAHRQWEAAKNNMHFL
jgi:hypothetical protein